MWVDNRYVLIVYSNTLLAIIIIIMTTWLFRLIEFPFNSKLTLLFLPINLQYSIQGKQYIDTSVGISIFEVLLVGLDDQIRITYQPLSGFVALKMTPQMLILDYTHSWIWMILRYDNWQYEFQYLYQMLTQILFIKASCTAICCYVYLFASINRKAPV